MFVIVLLLAFPAELLATEILCPDEWYPYGEHCYQYNSEKKSFDDAEAACAQQGGHLADIYSEEENDFVHSIANIAANRTSLVRIGLYYNISEANWLWTSTKNSANYTTFIALESTESPKDSTAAMVNEDTEYDTRWSKVEPGFLTGFVCEKKSHPKGLTIGVDDETELLFRIYLSEYLQRLKMKIQTGFITKEAEPDCRDMTEDCDLLIDRCFNGLWVDFMKQFCMLTCGFCTADFLVTTV